MTTSSPIETHTSTKTVSARRQWVARVWLAACLTLAAITASLGYFSPQTPTLKETRIDQMQVGAWVLAGNPTGEKDLQFGSEVDPPTWRKLTLTAEKKDGSTADVTLLRPLAWLNEQGAKVGGTIEISVPECGIEGRATIHTIDPCPTIKPRPGPEFQVVTATFKHQAAKVIALYVEGLDQPIGTTPNHPFWSETNQKFVRADALTPGEQLRQADGSFANVIRLNPRNGTTPVFNLEVGVDHTYHVASSGVLVHNTADHCISIYHGTTASGAARLTSEMVKPVGLDNGAFFFTDNLAEASRWSKGSVVEIKVSRDRISDLFNQGVIQNNPTGGFRLDAAGIDAFNNGITGIATH